MASETHVAIRSTVLYGSGPGSDGDASSASAVSHSAASPAAVIQPDVRHMSISTVSATSRTPSCLDASSGTVARSTAAATTKVFKRSAMALGSGYSGTSGEAMKLMRYSSSPSTSSCTATSRWRRRFGIVRMEPGSPGARPRLGPESAPRPLPRPAPRPLLLPPPRWERCQGWESGRSGARSARGRWRESVQRRQRPQRRERHRRGREARRALAAS
jgi:hypothetical protein